jgi:hypothetical protein
VSASTINNSSFCIYVFHMILRINSDYFLKQRQPVDLCNGEVLCFLCGTDWILKYYLDELHSPSYLLHFQTPYLHQTYLYQKDERALPGDLRSSKPKFMSPPVKSSAYRYSPDFLFSLLRVSKGWYVIMYTTDHVLSNDARWQDVLFYKCCYH